MSRTTVTLPQALVDEAMDEFKADSKAQAVVAAIHDALRRRRLQRLYKLIGSVEFVADAESLRHGDDRLG